jgi:site-specific DNA-methyltransferase (adenine-specific)
MQEEIDLRQASLGDALSRMTASAWDAVATSAWFTPADLPSPMPSTQPLAPASERLLRACATALRMGGLLFVYGAPQRLPAYAEQLDRLGNEQWSLMFKYWIAIQLHQGEHAKTLHSAHVGLLLYHKVARKGGTRFDLCPIRIPHQVCSACGQHLRDWGGKKHLMNPRGAALADVWLDLPQRSFLDHRIPDDVLARVAHLANASPGQLLHVVEAKWQGDITVSGHDRRVVQHDTATSHAPLLVDRVEVADCIAYMERLLPDYADNAFDLVFADPPYNLDKLYTHYTDAQAEAEYLAWCDRWLRLCARLLKPGGALFVLNLPQWALHLAHTLDKVLDFRHWIAWQALAEPRGKLLPAHYALLYYTKPGGSPTVNDPDAIDAPDYCLRAACITRRKLAGDDRKAPLTDVWSDIHRIRHRRNRDTHPCQLPEKLLERIIRLASQPGQLVFDPFCGAGTTAVVAKRLGRHFLALDIDPEYVRVTQDKLNQMEQTRAHLGEYIVRRSPIRRQSRPITKKQIESVVQDLARELGRAPQLEELRDGYPHLYEAVFELYRNPRKALGAARAVLGG